MTTANKTSLFVGLIILFISCSHEESVEPLYDWQKIELEHEGAVYSFYGNIDNTLMIGTQNKILKSEDGGKSWRPVHLVLDAIVEFKASHDTLFALANFTDYFSLNNGDNWNELKTDVIPSFSLTKKTSTNTYYKVQLNSNGELATPGFVLESVDGNAPWKNIFPYQHYIYSIYIDNSDGVYLGINGWTWDEQAGSFDSRTGNNAIIYYLKNNR